MVELITSPTPAVAWLKIVNRVVNKGELVLDERGSETLEVSNLVTEIQNPQDKTDPPNTIWTGEKLKIYEEQFLSDDKKGFVYTYGSRLMDYPNREGVPINQIDDIIYRLEQCRESRRAIAVTWYPVIDNHTDEVPCMILVDFKIRKGKLNITGVWRSHDVYGAVVANIQGLAALQQYVADQLCVQTGKMTIQSISAHIYMTNIDEAREISVKGSLL